MSCSFEELAVLNSHWSETGRDATKMDQTMEKPSDVILKGI